MVINAANKPVTISSDNDETARIDGAEKLGVEPDEVAVESADGETYTVSMLNAPGQFLDIVVSDRHMNAIESFEAITPPLGNGKPSNHTKICNPRG